LTRTEVTSNHLCCLFSSIKRLPHDIYYSVLICFTTVSCIYFVINQPDYSSAK
jgi:hypothetical protein